MHHYRPDTKDPPAGTPLVEEVLSHKTEQDFFLWLLIRWFGADSRDDTWNSIKELLWINDCRWISFCASNGLTSIQLVALGPMASGVHLDGLIPPPQAGRRCQPGAPPLTPLPPLVGGLHVLSYVPFATKQQPVQTYTPTRSIPGEFNLYQAEDPSHPGEFRPEATWPSSFLSFSFSYLRPTWSLLT